MRAILIATVSWRRTAALGVLALVAGAAPWLIRRPQPLPLIPMPPTRWVVGRVLEPYQGIAGAEVRLQALRPAAKDPLDRLTACDLYAGTLAVAHTDADGRFA